MGVYDNGANIYEIGRILQRLEKKFSLLLEAQNGQIQAQTRIIELLMKIVEVKHGEENGLG